MKYTEKLKDPRWQRRRLEIFSRDAWACQKCGDDKSELHVHHKEYTGEPWNAPDNFLVTLCDSCHKSTHDDRSEIDKDLTRLLSYPGRCKEYIQHKDHLVSEIALLFMNNESASMAMALEEYRGRPDFSRLVRAASYSA
jgi:hypothetical protein